MISLNIFDSACSSWFENEYHCVSDHCVSDHCGMTGAVEAVFIVKIVSIMNSNSKLIYIILQNYSRC